MILYKQHPFKAEINYAYREINTWLKSLGFSECFSRNENDFTEYHWTKNGVRIILMMEHKIKRFEKYVYLNADILQAVHPFALHSMKFKYDDYDKIMECHQQFVETARKLRIKI